MRPCSWLVLPVLIALLTLPTPPVAAQTTVGFAHPDDLTDLLSYRLPDWSYRVWDAGFSLDGGAQDARDAGESGFGNRTLAGLGSSFLQNWESERQASRVSGILSGRYFRSHQGSESRESRERSLQGTYRLDANSDRYLGDSLFFVGVGGRSARTYSESRDEFRIDTTWDLIEKFGRTSQHEARLGVGWGRVRNVVPLLRAQRISERLEALGRAPLTSDQVRRLAAILATEIGYREVFERSNRHFWQDVLGAFLPAGAPLNPYEIYYLADVLREDLGPRQQGVGLRAQFVYNEQRSDNGSDDNMVRRRRPELVLNAYHNLSLHHQLQADLVYGYHWDNSRSQSQAGALFVATLGHLWSVADRSRLESTVRFDVASDMETGRRSRIVTGSLAYHFRVEDRTSIVASTGTTYHWSRSPFDEEDFVWDWIYRVGLEFHLDRTVF